MKIATFAPHLAGRMLPGLFSQHVGKRGRFPGDPWPHMPVLPGLYWMHSDGCTAGLFRAFPVPSAYLTDPRAPTLRGDSAPTPPAKPKRLELFSRSKSTTVAAQCELFAGVRV